MVTQCLACELKPFSVSVISIHPGWVKTDMGTQAADLTIDESISGMVKVMENLNLPEETGKFYDYSGAVLPW